MSTRPFTSDNMLFLAIAPGISVHELPDGYVWVVSEQGLFSPICLCHGDNAPMPTTDVALTAMQAVMRLTHIQPELLEALQAIEPDSRLVFVPAPGYKVFASHAENPSRVRGWFVEDSFEHYNASEDQTSAWDACVAAVTHHLESEPAADQILEVASKRIADDDRIMLAEGVKVEREPGNPFRGAWVPARIWIKDADTASKAMPEDIASLNT